ARLMHIRVLPPDVNESELYFTPSNGDIRYGLAAVRNVGSAVVQTILGARTEKGRFETFTDFCRKVDSGVLNKKCMESLTLAGAFDSLHYSRRALFEGFEKITTPVLAERRAEAVGQESFFGGAAAPALAIDESVLAGAEFAKPELLSHEKEMLGSFVTDHPLLAIKDRLAAITDIELSELGNLGDGDVVTIGGIVGAVARRFTKRGEPYALFRLEDLTGGVQIVAFPGMFDKHAPLIVTDRILTVKGRADLRGRELQLVALEIAEPNLSEPGGDGHPAATPVPPGPLLVDVPLSACTGGLIGRLKALLGTHRGTVPVIVRLIADAEPTRLRLGEDFCVDGSPALLYELRRLLGPGAVRVAVEEPEPAAAPTPRAATAVR
ncbi:MAG TPA: DNA polymerase III subunit alpha, partial [Actinobacteria bacterium]|nr:DNA polymerase III subunit alpha [Actinomycetota bacterium]